MAAVGEGDAALAKSVQRASEDVQRAREIYQYFQPDDLVQPHLRRRSSTLEVWDAPTPSLSKALAPYCQLAALRCNVRKAMINVMDRNLMYFLSEATKVSAEEGEEIYEFVEDPIFLTCSSVPLEGRICDMTIRLANGDETTPPPMFVVPDLSVSQFAHMSIISGPPYYRFYAGVPITTGPGVNIGSLAIMDTSPRPNGLTHAEETFLASTARQIMLFLETNRQAIEGRHSRRMTEGLDAFIAGRKSIIKDKLGSHQDGLLRKRSKIAYGLASPRDNDAPLPPGSLSKPGEYGTQGEHTNSQELIGSEFSASEHTSDTESTREKVDSDGDSRSHAKTFGRAANLLRECLGDLGEEGGVAFISLSSVLGDSSKKRPSNSFSRAPPAKHGMGIHANVANMNEEQESRVAQSSCIAFSTQPNPFIPDKGIEDRHGIFEDEMLHDWVRRYPGGRLWSLDVNVSSSSEDDLDSLNSLGRTPARPHKRSRRKQLEFKALRAAFPSAGQVLFAPLWNATTGSFSYACFVATALDTRSFSPSVELPFLNSFCSTLMAECSRLDTMMADKQKSDFVGTISHEMRSPLHGLLASVEFLAETDLTGFQQSLISTIDSCGRTLLDTINHVLDFSKINSFQKHWQASNKKHSHSSRRHNFLGPETPAKSVPHGAPALLQLFSVIDVSAVLEEVVDGLVLGHTYNSRLDFTELASGAQVRDDGILSDHGGNDILDPVKLVLDVQQADWNFLTQPGAVRRIIMNITGNAIKYTSKGTINVRLRLHDSPEDDANQIMVLTVTDTGKGISQEFLSSRLFMPFAQENALAPGTGLGLSIVRSIILMLGGTIDVKSKVNQGTTVEVCLPIKRPLPGQTSTQTTPYSGATNSSASSAYENSISLLKAQMPDATVTFYRARPEDGAELAQVIKSYVRDWYGLQFVDQRLCESSSVIVLEEEDLESLITQVVGTPGSRPALVVMCSILSKHSAALIQSLEARLRSAVEFVSEPCGPHKLARSIRLALEKKQTMKPRSSLALELGATPPAVVSSSVSPPAPESVAEGLQEMDLNLAGEMDAAKVVQATETFAASQASQNAQMAIHDPLTALRTPRNHVSEGDSFPFPMHTKESSRLRRESDRGSLALRKDLSNPPTPTEPPPAPVTIPSSTPDAMDPHVLLVDDNKINLKLLETFLKAKCKYSRIEKAEDGLEAVNTVTAAADPFDIIFMDISMPVLNGFEATRAIRQLEDTNGIKPGAMIIALTGLASARDQTEVFNCGCDIYMTKPVSFKEVRKLLSNWEAHRNINLPG